MPNMFGGDQFHPAYDPRTADEIECDPYKVLVGNRLYRISDDGKFIVYFEDVDGTAGVAFSYPDEVVAAINKLRKK